MLCACVINARHHFLFTYIKMNPILNRRLPLIAVNVGIVSCPNVVPLRYFNHRLSFEHLSIQKTCRDFAQKELSPIAAKLDNEAKFPTEQIKKLGDLGLLAIGVSQSNSGMGYDSLSTAVAVEELSRGCAGTGAIVSIHNCLYADLLDRRGSDKQKEQYLVPYTKGDIGCFALSEPNAGSDVGNLQTTARKDGEFWILNGTKSWVTSALDGKAIIVFANVDKTRKHRGISAFVMDLNTPGITLGTKDDLMGIRALSSCTVTLNDVRVHNDNVLGDIGQGFKIAMAQLDRARIGISSQALGIAQAALDCAVKYSMQRMAFGKPLSQISAVQHRLAEMAVRLEGARLLTWKAAVEIDSNYRSTKHSSIAKVAASTCANFVADNCVQILGGMGYAKGFSAERHYRDARVTQIYGGVTDVQKMVIAQQLIKEYI